jgi:cell division transport system permease protein
MRAIDYAVREAWASLRRRRSASAFAIGAIALALTVPGALFLLTWNAERVVARWSSVAEFSVYLRDDATSEQRGAIETLIDNSGASVAREYVSKEEALARFRREFSELASLTSTFDDNPFPASVEVRVRPEAERAGRTASLARDVATLPGVADIQYDREWLNRLAAGLGAVRNAGFALALLMAMAAAATVTAVVRLGLHARQEELEIMHLVGSPLAFIRAPFVAEGLLQGGLGALLAVGALWVGYAAVSARWGADLAGLLDGVSLTFMPVRLCLYLIAGGMLVGGAGGWAASRHAA